GSTLFTRGKRQKASGSASPQKILNMLSLISPRRKQPYRLSLTHEDHLRHRTVVYAWSTHLRDVRTTQRAELRAQYSKIVEACSELAAASPELFDAAMGGKGVGGERLAMEYRIPGETPPTVAFDAKWVAPSE
ncbi:mitochondrial 54S ribosomal protein mL40, partial [Limtongia smithiae]|uniref:mitochondrial 54S ribosomal protein mL40 n=1 Tax=Limtongia smithiae TaxID=1125753 RepID=UPI0034CF4BD2